MAPAATEETMPDETDNVQKELSFRDELERAINRHSRENGSDTPDFILAAFLHGCLVAFDETVRARERWYGRHLSDPNTPPPTAPPSV